MASALTKKGFTAAKGDHVYYTYHHRKDDGSVTETAIFTKISHNSGDLDDYLLKKMAKQCQVSKDEFLKFVDCDLSEKDFGGLPSVQSAMLNGRKA